MQNVKDYREKELKYYAIVNCFIVVFVAWNGSDRFLFVDAMALILNKENENGLAVIISELIGAGVISSIASVYAFLLDSLISSEMKYKICYLFFGKQPGYTIFSDMRNGKGDSRFTTEEAIAQYDDIYTKLDGDSSENEKRNIENAAWYKIYSKHKDNSMIFNANRDYLLCRDLCVMTVAIIVLYVSSCIFGVTEFHYKLFCFLIFEVCVTNVAFRLKGKRLAFDVLALDICDS